MSQKSYCEREYRKLYTRRIPGFFRDDLSRCLSYEEFYGYQLSHPNIQQEKLIGKYLHVSMLDNFRNPEKVFEMMSEYENPNNILHSSNSYVAEVTNHSELPNHVDWQNFLGVDPLPQGRFQQKFFTPLRYLLDYATEFNDLALMSQILKLRSIRKEQERIINVDQKKKGEQSLLMLVKSPEALRLLLEQRPASWQAEEIRKLVMEIVENQGLVAGQKVKFLHKELWQNIGTVNVQLRPWGGRSIQDGTILPKAHLIQSQSYDQKTQQRLNNQKNGEFIVVTNGFRGTNLGSIMRNPIRETIRILPAKSLLMIGGSTEVQKIESMEILLDHIEREKQKEESLRRELGERGLPKKDAQGYIQLENYSQLVQEIRENIRDQVIRGGIVEVFWKGNWQKAIMKGKSPSDNKFWVEWDNGKYSKHTTDYIRSQFKQTYEPLEFVEAIHEGQWKEAQILQQNVDDISEDRPEGTWCIHWVCDETPENPRGYKTERYDQYRKDIQQGIRKIDVSTNKGKLRYNKLVQDFHQFGKRFLTATS